MLNRTSNTIYITRVVFSLLLAGVLVLSFLPSNLVDPVRPHILGTVDIGHILAYLLLTGTAMLSMSRQRLTPWRGAGIALGIGLLSLAVELLQPLAGRKTSFIDLTENMVGIFFGIAIFYGYLVFERTRIKNGSNRLMESR